MEDLIHYTVYRSLFFIFSLLIKIIPKTTNTSLEHLHQERRQLVNKLKELDAKKKHVLNGRKSKSHIDNMGSNGNNNPSLQNRRKHPFNPKGGLTFRSKSRQYPL